MKHTLTLIFLTLCANCSGISLSTVLEKVVTHKTSIALTTGGFLVPTLCSMYNSKQASLTEPLLRHAPCFAAGAAVHHFAPLKNFTSQDIKQFLGFCFIAGFCTDVVAKTMFASRPLRQTCKNAFFQALVLPCVAVALAATVHSMYSMYK